MIGNIVVEYHMTVTKYKIINVRVSRAVFAGKLHERFVIGIIHHRNLFGKITA